MDYSLMENLPQTMVSTIKYKGLSADVPFNSGYVQGLLMIFDIERI